MTQDDTQSQEPHELVPAATSSEVALDTTAALSTMIPLLGGAISNVLSGLSQDRKMARVNEVLWSLAEDVKQFSTEAEQFVKTEDFQELLEETLRRVHGERSEEKRRIYRDFLVGAIQSPGEPYDEQIRFLRVLEELQPDNIRVLRAVLQEPDPNPPHSIGSTRQTLKERLPDMEESHIADLVVQLSDLKIATIPGGIMAARGAQDLRGHLTPFGKRFVRYIEE
jgi:hypothetical protein